MTPRSNAPKKLMLALAVGIGLGAVAAAPAVQDGDPEPDRVAEAIARGVEVILELQEGEGNAEWPYEGVYRVRRGNERRIPIGYRVGGTAISSTSLILAPGYDDDPRRQQAVARSTRFIVESIAHPFMSHDVDASYDVRGWGYTYGLLYLLRIKTERLVPDDLTGSIEEAIEFFVAGIEATSIPERGGWNYARRAGFDQPGSPSPFMTGATLQALFEAAAQGYDVDAEVIESGLASLEDARAESGAYVYSGAAEQGSERTLVPGAIGRMPIAEVTLAIAGRSSTSRIRGAVDAFIVHWDWLEQRRARTGTHAKPYGIAPYYFYFAHYYAAQAVEQLPDRDRDEYRRRLNDLLFATRAEDGSWNDRVFARSANYGTAMAISALMMPTAAAPAKWDGGEDDLAHPDVGP